MRPEARKFLYDIRKACDLIARFSASKTFADYSADPLLKSGVERQFEIIGEALSQMLKIDPSLAGHVTETRRIIAFRNILIHGYAAVSDEVVWDVLRVDLPTLRKEVGSLLESAQGSA